MRSATTSIVTAIPCRARSGRFTDQGLTAHALEFAAGTLAPRLRRARRAVDEAKQEVAARRPDRADAAAQILRLWKLDKFNALPDHERNALVADAASLDPDLAAAILQAPRYSKVLPSDLDRLRDHALTTQYSEEAIADVRELETGIKIAEDVVTAAREEIALDVGGLAAFNAAAKPYESVAGAWLRRVLKNGVESVETFKHVRDGNGRPHYRWVQATPEEVETGLFAKTHEEWKVATGGVVPLIRGEDAAWSWPAGAGATQ